MRHFSRTRAAGIFLAAVATTLFGMAVPAAQATTLEQSCLLTETITWEPPLKSTPQTVTFTTHGQLTNCTNPSAPAATYFETGTYDSATCTSAGLGRSGVRVWRWTSPDAAPSAFSYTVQGARVNGTIEAVATGTIISGAFENEPVKSEGVAPELDPLACMTTGVSRISAVGAIAIGL